MSSQNVYSKRLNRCYEHVLENFQYGSIKTFYQYDGQQLNFPVDNCMWQAFKLKDLLVTTGFKDSYVIRAINSRHHAVITKIDGNYMFLDSYLMNKRPINLDKVKNNKAGKASFPAYPSTAKQKSFLGIKFIDENKFTVTKTEFNNKKTVTSNFLFDLKDEINVEGGLEKHKEFIYHPEQTTLSVRLLDVKAGRITSLCYPVSKLLDCRDVNQKHLYFKKENGKKITFEAKSFDNELKKFLQYFACSKESLINLILTGAALYYKNYKAVSTDEFLDFINGKSY